MSQAQMIRVLIVDDHTIVRRGIKALLAQSNDIQVIDEADNGLGAIRLSKELEPDVILMDLLMPIMDGIEATRQITTQQSNVRVLVMTSFIFAEEIIPAIKAGAVGCLLKDSEPWELVQSIYKVHRGEPSLPSSIARKMMQDTVDAPTEKTTQEPLTSKEVDVLQILDQSLSNDDVDVQLKISEPIVRSQALMYPGFGARKQLDQNTFILSVMNRVETSEHDFSSPATRAMSTVVGEQVELLA